MRNTARRPGDGVADRTTRARSGGSLSHGAARQHHRLSARLTVVRVDVEPDDLRLAPREHWGDSHTDPMMRTLNYEDVGATRPGERTWTETPPGYRRYERTVRIGQGAARWETVTAEVLEWTVKTRSGFTVAPLTGGDARARLGAEYMLTAAVGPFRVREPIRVVATVDEPDRCGFSYGTLEGHPVSGEEAFIVHRSPDATVWLTLRSLTRPAQGPWRLAFPAILVAQRWYRRRYGRALTRRAS
jgi:uncharacterized protein (UPF0548 family)